MRAFVALVEELDGCRGSRARVQAMARWLAAAAERSPADAAWALHCLLGRQRRRLITGLGLRRLCQQASGLPEWLFEDCHAQVGDSAETIALLRHQLPPVPAAAAAAPHHGAADLPLHRWMEELLPWLAALPAEEQTIALPALWQQLDDTTLLVACKLLTGGFRLGVGPALVLRALQECSGLELTLLQHRLMGGFKPSAEAWQALLAPAGADAGHAGRPYPFCLAAPLPAEPALPGGVEAWLVEWKWDGIRGQLLHRPGHRLLWSRGEELLNEAFPELADLVEALPQGTVLDGEVLVWPEADQRPAPFAQLQRRLGRRSPGRRLLAECPAVFLAYDLLEHDGADLRDQPLARRRAALERLVADLGGTQPALRLSQRLPLERWQDLDPLRRGARAVGAEGLMLKALVEPYRAGRRRGCWWKHKLEPLRLDAVLLYAQAGSGRRANLYTDYTFGLWSEPPGAGSGPRLVSFARAYSGLDDEEIQRLDRWIRSHTTERFGPVRAVQPEQVFEIAFEGLQPSRRHRSGLAARFPRISRWRTDKPAHEASCLADAHALLETL
jgi:DNA ligase-1